MRTAFQRWLHPRPEDLGRRLFLLVVALPFLLRALQRWLHPRPEDLGRRLFLLVVALPFLLRALLS
jgi:hypothetical protein